MRGVLDSKLQENFSDFTRQEIVSGRLLHLFAEWMCWVFSQGRKGMAEGEDERYIEGEGRRGDHIPAIDWDLYRAWRRPGNWLQGRETLLIFFHRWAKKLNDIIIGWSIICAMMMIKTMTYPHQEKKILIIWCSRESQEKKFLWPWRGASASENLVSRSRGREKTHHGRAWYYSMGRNWEREKSRCGYGYCK